MTEQVASNVHVQVDANLALVGFDAEKDFDAIVSADLFERLKPAPDIFLAAAKQVPPSLLLSCVSTAVENGRIAQGTE